MQEIYNQNHFIWTDLSEQILMDFQTFKIQWDQDNKKKESLLSEKGKVHELVRKTHIVKV